MNFKPILSLSLNYLKNIVIFLCPIILALIDNYLFQIFNWNHLISNEFFLLILFYASYVLIIALWQIPIWQTKNLRSDCTSKEIGQLQDTYRKTIAQIAGGIALLAGLYFTWSNLITVQQGQITDRFTKAVEQLGNENIAIRLGGIYALDRIYRDSPSDRTPIINILSAYVRTKAKISYRIKELNINDENDDFDRKITPPRRHTSSSIYSWSSEE